MHFEVTPEPTEEERRAIERALAAAEATPYASAWRRAGTDPDDEDAPTPARASGGS